MPKASIAHKKSTYLSPLEEEFALQLRAVGLPLGEREYVFHPKRRWRFDFAWPEKKIAVEIEGIPSMSKEQGRHQRLVGFSNDCTKYNEAQVLGWRVFRFTKLHLQDLETLRIMEMILR